MHIPSDRFDLSPTDKRRLAAFEDFIWTSPEVCNECFTRIRAIEDHPTAAEVAADSLRNPPPQHHERTEHATAEWCGWESNDRFPTTFCECGSDGHRQSDQLPLEELAEQLTSLLKYTLQHTPFRPDGQAAAAELKRLKKRRDTSGYDGQILALAWARSVEREPTDANGGVTADS